MLKHFSSGCLLLAVLTSTVLLPVKVKGQNSPEAEVTTTTQVCPAQLEGKISQIINSPNFSRARWGIKIQPLANNQTLYSQDAQKFFIPASVTKLFTTAAVLQELGSDFQFRTSIVHEDNNTLRVIGSGDPSLNDAQLLALAQQLRQKGITRIDKLIADDSSVRGDIVESSWQWEDIQADYGAPVGSFIVNQNTFKIRLLPQTVGQPLKVIWDDIYETYNWQILNQSTTVAANASGGVSVTRNLAGNVLRIQGQLPENASPIEISLPVVDPNEFFLRRLRINLLRKNIRLGQTSVGRGTSTQEIAGVFSSPLSQLVAKTNTDSDNSYAESLLRALAFRQPSQTQQSSVSVGLDILRKTLAKLGVDKDTYKMVDGSGLSRKNLISPEALIQLIKGVEKTDYKDVFRASLPIAGETGTLKRRFGDSPAAGIVQAKTGTMTGVVSLAGHIQPPNYEPLVFSIMVNQTDESIRNIRQAVDEIVVTLAKLKRC